MKEQLYNEDNLPYILSMSRKINSLDMWRTYANDGTGICIVFSEFELRKYNYNIVDVNYDSITKSCPEYNVMKGGYERYYNLPSLMKMQGISLFNEKLKHFLSNMVAISPSLKRKEFEYEKEARIYKFAKIQDDVRFRKSNMSNIVPYIELAFPISTIKEIIVGPCADFFNTKKMLSMLLKSKEVSIDIKDSKISYRQF